MEEREKPIIVNMAEGQNTLTILQGEAPKQLDILAPKKVDIKGVITAPLEWLEKRVQDIDQHKAYILVNRDDLSILLVFNEDDPYKQGKVLGVITYSDIFTKLGINGDKGWMPLKLGMFLKLNRSFFKDRQANMKVVSALMSFDAHVDQALAVKANEKGDRAAKFQQSVNSNLPEKFTLKMPIFSGGETVEFEVETWANVDGTDVTIHLQSAGANDLVEEAKANTVTDVIAKIKDIAPDIPIIEQ